MDVSSHIYKISEIPRDLIDELESEKSELKRLLNLESYEDSESKDVEDFLGEIDEYPVDPILPDRIDLEIHRYTKAIFGKEKNISKLYRTAIEEENEGKLRQLVGISNILAEQTVYLDYDLKLEKNCSIWFILGKISDFPYGGIFAFWNVNKPDILFIQGISKFLVPSLVAMFLPDYDKSLPRLNSLLMPSVESLASQQGAKKIMVVPVGKQVDILQKYYGFIKTSNVYYPCNGIMGKENVVSEFTRDISVLVKELPP